jgi:hypothetical protein
MRRAFLVAILLFSCARPLAAQSETKDETRNETKLGAEWRNERKSLGGCKRFSGLVGCAETAFSGQPFHIAVGSIAPQNGFGAGAAFVAHWTPNESWRLSWDVDAIGSINGSWRAGAYMKAIYTRPKKTTESRGRHSQQVQPNDTEDPVFHLYAQTISLNKITYFGLGPNTSRSGQTFYGMRETIPGINGWWPVWQPPKVELSLFGEFNGRFIEIRPSPGQPSPSIEQIYTEATAPGLTSQPGFVEQGEGLLLKTKPALWNDRVRLNYRVGYDQFWAPAASRFGFGRFTTDLSHQIALHSTTKTYLPGYQNGPDECSESLDKPSCPAVTKNLDGSIDLRFFLSESLTDQGHVVPFYLQPTLGGSDINGNSVLASFEDYRFRAPKVFFLHQGLEHSIGKWPLGVALAADEGEVALSGSSFGSGPWRRSYSAGLTIRAGGFPQVWLLFAWGGNEGTHTIANVNTSLLGGAARPSLY